MTSPHPPSSVPLSPPGSEERGVNHGSSGVSLLYVTILFCAGLLLTVC
jgi:hypothetical protein